MASKSSSKGKPAAVAKKALSAVKKGTKVVAKAAAKQAKTVKKTVAPAAKTVKKSAAPATKKLVKSLPSKGKSVAKPARPGAKSAVAVPAAKSKVVKAPAKKVQPAAKARPVAKVSGKKAGGSTAPSRKPAAKMVSVRSGTAQAARGKAASTKTPAAKPKAATSAQKHTKGTSGTNKKAAPKSNALARKAEIARSKVGPKSASSRTSASAQSGRDATMTPKRGSTMPAKSATVETKSKIRPIPQEPPPAARASKETPERDSTAKPTASPLMEKKKSTSPTVPAETASTVEPPIKKAKPKLKESDLKKLRENLEHERARIIEEMRILDDRSLTANLEEGANQQPGFSLQLADSASDNMQVETDLGIRSIEAEQLQQIDEALRAIQSGDYGICQRCQEAISVERLTARPSAKYCIDCLKLLESGKA